MRRRLGLVFLTALCGLALVPPAGAKPLLGVVGDMGRMQSQTGQRSDGLMRFIGWGFGMTWGKPLREPLPADGRRAHPLAHHLVQVGA